MESVLLQISIWPVFVNIIPGAIILIAIREILNQTTRYREISTPGDEKATHLFMVLNRATKNPLAWLVMMYFLGFMFHDFVMLKTIGTQENTRKSFTYQEQKAFLHSVTSPGQPSNREPSKIQNKPVASSSECILASLLAPGTYEREWKLNTEPLRGSDPDIAQKSMVARQLVMSYFRQHEPSPAINLIFIRAQSEMLGTLSVEFFAIAISLLGATIVHAFKQHRQNQRGVKIKSDYHGKSIRNNLLMSALVVLFALLSLDQYQSDMSLFWTQIRIYSQTTRFK